MINLIFRQFSHVFQELGVILQRENFLRASQLLNHKPFGKGQEPGPRRKWVTNK